jgi:hypothetical protein
VTAKEVNEPTLSTAAKEVNEVDNVGSLTSLAAATRFTGVANGVGSSLVFKVQLVYA